jgi:hypothetical protein
MVQATIHYTAAWGVGITAIAGIGGVILTNVLNGRREDERAARTRADTVADLVRQDRLRAEAAERENQLRFLDSRRDLYAQCLASCHLLENARDDVDINLEDFLATGDVPSENDRAEFYVLDDVVFELNSHLAQIELIAPEQVWVAAEDLRIASLELSIAVNLALEFVDGIEATSPKDNFDESSRRTIAAIDEFTDAARKDLGVV